MKDEDKLIEMICTRILSSGVVVTRNTDGTVDVGEHITLRRVTPNDEWHIRINQLNIQVETAAIEAALATQRMRKAEIKRKNTLGSMISFLEKQ